MSDKPLTDAAVSQIEVDPREVDAEMIGGLYRRVTPLIVANFGALILLTLALWRSADRTHLLVWAVALASWTMLRFAIARLYMRRPRPVAETWRWTAAFTVGSGVAGVLWGSSFLLVGSLEGDSNGLISAFVMAALSAAAIAGYTNSLPAFAAFIYPALLPYSVELVRLDGTISPTIAGFVVFWGVLLWVMARHLNERFRESLTLVLRNRNLAGRLKAERDRAQAASRAKTRFLGHMSHELRTPLNAIIGYAGMIGQQVFGPLGHDKYAEYVADIESSGGHLKHIIDQVLDVAELEDGRATLSEDTVDVGETMGRAVEAVTAGAGDGFPPVCVRVPPDLPRLRGDAARVEQIVTNLLSNAVRFAPADGRVTVSVDIDEGGGLRLTVTDTGPGMPEDTIARAQIPFGQLDGRDHLQRTDTPVNDGGHTTLGLGLPLARLLTELHGGGLDLDSAPGKGTTATVRFPAERVVPGEASANPAHTAA